jgi:hypothetical protein
VYSRKRSGSTKKIIIHIDLRINNLKLRKKHIEEKKKKAAIVSYVINEKY